MILQHTSAITRKRLLFLSFSPVILRLLMMLQEINSCNTHTHVCAAGRWKVMTQGCAKQSYSHVTDRVCTHVFIPHQSLLVRLNWALLLVWLMRKGCDFRTRKGRKIPMTEISSVQGKLGLFLWNHSSSPDVTAHHFLLYTCAALTGRTNHRLTLKYRFQTDTSLVFLKQLLQITSKEF